MYMLTSRHNVLKAVAALTTLWLLLTIQFAFADTLVSVRPLASKDASSVEKIRQQISLAVQKDESFPRDATPKVKAMPQNGRVVSFNLGTYTSIPILITFQGIENSYCRFAVLRSDTNIAQIVPAPTRANSPDCSSIALLTDADINSDGIPDMVFRVKLKSNRYPGFVYEYHVYLSHAAEKLSYCFSVNASSAASDVQKQGAAAMFDALRAEVARRGAGVFECWH